MKRALITGISGQVGSYMAELLLSKGYEVHGLVRRHSSMGRERIDHLPSLHLHYGDMTDSRSLREALKLAKPDEVYNFAAQSHVAVSFTSPTFTTDVVYGGLLSLLHEVHDICPSARVYQAGTSEMFGDSPAPQSEATPFRPMSPYAVAKAAAYDLCRHFRDRGLFVVNGISFNCESPRRGEAFVTRKITKAVGEIKRGERKVLPLGNLNARRDWGFAGDYVKGMWLSLQVGQPLDIIFATGRSASVKEFLSLAFNEVNLDWRDFVSHDPLYERPSDVPHLEGDATKARLALGWEATTSLEELVKMMVKHDLKG